MCHIFLSTIFDNMFKEETIKHNWTHLLEFFRSFEWFVYSDDLYHAFAMTEKIPASIFLKNQCKIKTYTLSCKHISTIFISNYILKTSPKIHFFSRKRFKDRWLLSTVSTRSKAKLILVGLVTCVLNYKCLLDKKKKLQTLIFVRIKRISKHYFVFTFAFSAIYFTNKIKLRV